ncbi:zinc-dependent peptidase [Aquimarina sp. W85]|uniref:zinc-dependent peptidase n=1 Tax=Aquimarina rhodophyticola TaxID=3342246 RepID=UPI00366F2116
MILLLLQIVSQQKEDAEPPITPFWGVVFTVMMLSICVYYILRYLETIYVKYYKKPFYTHFYFRLKKLSSKEKKLLSVNEVYNVLSERKKRYFEHRVATFLDNTTFVGREGLHITLEMRLLIAMLAVQLTFGMRHYILERLQTIILYPDSFYSVLNGSENYGEFNPGSKALVMSWNQFEKTRLDKYSGVHLGIHELTHVIHYNAIRKSDINSELFYDTFLELEAYLSSEKIRNQIVDSKVLRSYAYTNKFEFIAVLVEVFMETPQKLKDHFPEIYRYVMKMLNFRYFE